MMSSMAQKKEKTRKSLIIFLIATFLLTLAAGPLVSALGINIQALSLFEFYFINLILSPKIKEASLKDWFEHITSDLWSSIKTVFLSLGSLQFLSLVAIGLGFAAIPALTTLSISFNLIIFASVYCGLHVVFGLISLFDRKAHYKHLSIKPLVLSVLFATLTDLAFSYIAVNTVIAAGIYAATLIPLVYFALSAYQYFNESKKEDYTHIPFVVGLTSLTIHITEAACMVFGVLFSQPALLGIASTIAANAIQGPLLAATTSAAAWELGDSFANQTEASMVPAPA